MKKKLITTAVLSSFFSLAIYSVVAQSWNITGNNNTTALSKLGTTNFIPVSLYTDNQERIRIDETGRVGIGTSAPVNILTVKSTAGVPVATWTNGLTSPVFVGFAENASSESVLAAASNISLRRPVLQGRRSRGTLSSPTAVLNNDYLSSFLASGFDGNTFQNPATIDFFVDGVPSAGNVPARISFVTGSNQGNRTERLKVGSTGDFNFNNNQLFIDASTARVGIGTLTPDRKLHVFNGSAGAVIANLNSPLVVENNVNSFISVLAPSGSERGILFGDNLDAQDGGIIYNGSANSLQFRTNGNTTRMTLSSAGNLDIAGGTLSFGSVETFADAGSFTISSNSDFVPSSNNGSSLGNPSLRWSAVWAVDGTINTSDAREKTNIRNLNYGIKEIMKLRSTRFNWKNGSEDGDKLGLIAQDLQKVLPEVVRDWQFKINEETGAKEKVPSPLLGVAYSDIIPVLIHGIQEQQVDLEEKDQKIATLQAELDNLNSDISELKTLLVKKGVISGYDLNSPANSLSSARLEQSVPNPSGGVTTLRYFLPNEVKKAAIQITSVNGAILKSYPVANGSGQLTIQANELAAGVYIYTLMVNGNKFASKKMVVTK